MIQFKGPKRQGGFWNILIPVVLSAIGITTSYRASRKAAKVTERAGERQQVALDFEAEQFDLAAGQMLASGQYAAGEVRRRGKIVESDLIARVAAGGGNVSDPTIMALIGRTAGEVQHRAMIERYAAEDEARTLRARAETARMGGVSALTGSKAAASAIRTGGIASAVVQTGGLMARFWKPPTST